MSAGCTRAWYQMAERSLSLRDREYRKAIKLSRWLPRHLKNGLVFIVIKISEHQIADRVVAS